MIQYCKSLIFCVLYFAVFPMNVSSLEFNFADFELLYCYNPYTAKTFMGYLISRKQFIHKINPTQNLRLLQHKCIYACGATQLVSI